jgi:rare lipoprotein A
VNNPANEASMTLLRLAVGMCGVLLLFGCSSASRNNESLPDQSSATATARGYKVGKPYNIKGVWYYPHVDYDYVEEGVASWYGPGFHGRSTANGETYDMNDLTAAHRTLPMPSVVRVTNLENGRSMKLKVNDRGPFARDRIIDVSRRASQLLGFHIQGTTPVRVEIVEDESRMLAAALGVPSEVAWAATRSAPPPAPAPEPLLVAEAPAAPVSTSAVDDEQVSAAVAPTTASSPAFTGYASSYTAASSYAPPPEQDLPPEPSTLDPVETAETDPIVAPVAGAGQRWIQAGAFADPGRAAAASRRLAGLGPTMTSPSFVGGRELLRVRVGPFSSQEEAQRMLASVTQAGFQGSRIVAD